MGQITKPNTFSNTPPNTNVIDAAQVNADFDTLYAEVNGNLDDYNLKSAVKDKIGLSDGTIIRRGKSIIATTEARTNTAYGLLTTPDQVANIVLPTDGLIAVAYQATWQESVAGAASAAIFIGANQLKLASVSGIGGPAVQEATHGGSAANADASLHTRTIGLYGAWTGTGAPDAYTGDVTTGQIVGDSTAGGLCYIFAAAGAYTISVQFKASSGSVTAKNRKLWVWTIGF